MFKIGIIGGSGFENPDFIKEGIQRIAGNKWGRIQELITTGFIQDIPVVFISRHGKNHTISPTEVEYRANIYQLKEEGCTHIIGVSACGSLQHYLEPGDLVIPDQFIDFTYKRKDTFFDTFGEGSKHVSLADPFDSKLRSLLKLSCNAFNSRSSSTHDRGVVATIEGPRFSTRAESIMYKKLGADIINMTTATEAILAKELGVPYASICMVTDYDSWCVDQAPVTMEMITDTLHNNVKKTSGVFHMVLKNIKRGYLDGSGEKII